MSNLPGINSRDISKSTFFDRQAEKGFFEDPFKLAGYAMSNYPHECEKTIKKADRVTQQRFQFNLRWDLERCDDVVFDDEIDWLHQPAGDPEWVYAFNRMSFWICLGKAYALTRDEKYAAAFAGQLNHWVKNVPQSCEMAWRSIEAGMRLEYWLKAVSYFEASPAVTDVVINTFCKSVIEHAEFLMNLWDPYNLMSNWGVFANRGLLLAGAMLPETTRTIEYINEAKRRLSLEMQIQVYRDGVHWEQSPMYHNEVLECYLDVVRLAQCYGISLPDNITRQTLDMCYFNMFSAKPDHHEICMGDSDNIDRRDLLTRGAVLFRDRYLKSRTHKKPDYDSLWELGKGGIGSFAALESSLPGETDKSFPDSNNYYFRSGWDDPATFVHFTCGTLGAGHGHADKLHIDVFSRGEDILLDPGRYTYVFGEDRIRYKELRAHNVLMADGRDFYICKDSWECTGLTRGINRNFYSDSRYGYAEGGHLAYIDRGLYINRRVIYIKPDLIILADEFYAAGEHTYNQFFHWGNAGILKGEGNNYVYQTGNVEARMFFLTDGLESKISDGFISRHYNREEPGKVIETSFTGNGFTGAFTVLALGDTNSGKKLNIEKQKVESTFKSITFKDSQIEALNIEFGSKLYTVVVAHEEFASPTDTFNTAGCIGFGNCVIFDRSAGESEVGTVLLW